MGTVGQGAETPLTYSVDGEGAVGYVLRQREKARRST